MKGEAMEEGRELDALVAERVMGWTLSDNRMFGRPPGWTDPNNLSIPRYSTNIRDAWDVVEKIHDIQPRFVLEPQPFVRPRLWWCSVYGHDRVAAPTAALAICLAALKYVQSGALTKT